VILVEEMLPMLTQPETACPRPCAGNDCDTSPCRQASLSHTSEVVPLLEQVEAEMVGRGYSERFCRELRLVLEEALVNGLRHGNRNDPDHRVVLRYRVGVEEVLAEVEDEGEGFDPAAVPDPTDPENLCKPGGRGLLLMRHYTTWLRYHGCGNRVTFCKRRPPH
jgi:serine/threonine-protein kinase RsbW